MTYLNENQDLWYKMWSIELHCRIVEICENRIDIFEWGLNCAFITQKFEPASAFSESFKHSSFSMFYTKNFKNRWKSLNTDTNSNKAIQTSVFLFQARFQAKQLEEKEEKLIHMLEEKQVKICGKKYAWGKTGKNMWKKISLRKNR